MNFIGFSPNEQTGLTFQESLDRLSSPEHQQFREMADYVLRSNGLTGTSHDIVGDWNDPDVGPDTENGVLQVIPGQHDPKTLEHTAAWYGLMGNQKSVMVAHSSPQGPGAVYQVHVPAVPMDQVRQVLDQAGITFRAVKPSPSGSLVVVADSDGSLRPAIQQVAGQLNGSVRELPARIQFIGGTSRDEARPIYRDIIRGYSGTGSVASGLRTDEPDNVRPSHEVQTFARPKRIKGTRIVETAFKINSPGSEDHGQIIPSGPHHDFSKLSESQRHLVSGMEQTGGEIIDGFLTDQGEFVDREQAYQIVKPNRKPGDWRNNYPGQLTHGEYKRTFSRARKSSYPRQKGLLTVGYNRSGPVGYSDDNDYYPGHPAHPRTVSINNPKLAGLFRKTSAHQELGDPEDEAEDEKELTPGEKSKFSHQPFESNSGEIGRHAKRSPGYLRSAQGREFDGQSHSTDTAQYAHRGDQAASTGAGSGDESSGDGVATVQGHQDKARARGKHPRFNIPDSSFRKLIALEQGFGNAYRQPDTESPESLDHGPKGGQNRFGSERYAGAGPTVMGQGVHPDIGNQLEQTNNYLGSTGPNWSGTPGGTGGQPGAYTGAQNEGWTFGNPANPAGGGSQPGQGRGQSRPTTRPMSTGSSSRPSGIGSLQSRGKSGLQMMSAKAQYYHALDRSLSPPSNTRYGAGDEKPFGDRLRALIAQGLHTAEHPYEDIPAIRAEKQKQRKKTQLAPGRLHPDPRVGLRNLEGGASSQSYGSKGKVHKVMKEFKEGTLHSGSKHGPKVRSRKQAIAIGMSEARKAGQS